MTIKLEQELYITMNIGKSRDNFNKDGEIKNVSTTIYIDIW